MGVQSGTNQQTQQASSFTGHTAAAAEGMSAQTNAAASQHEAAASNMWSFEGAGLPEIVSTKAGGADVRTIQATIAAIMAKEQPQSGFEVDTLIIDNTVEVGWRFSSVITTLKQKDTNTVAFFPLVLESTASAPLEADLREVGAVTYSVDHVPSDALDASFVERILKAVADAHPGSNLVDCGGMVVPKNIDASVEDQVRPILHNAARACMTAIVEQNPDFIDMNLGLRVDNTYQTVSLQVTNQHSMDIVEQPIRQDAIITLTSRQKQDNQQAGQQRNRSIHSIGATEKVIGGIGGFFDATFAPKAGNTGYTSYGANPLDRTRQFVKRFTVTALNQPRLATLASTLLLLNQASVLSEQSVSDSVFFQRMKQHRLDAGPKDKGVDVTDVGALNLASNVKAEQTPTVFDLKSNTTTTDIFASFMDQVFMPGFALAIDVPRSGPQSWVLDVFTAAASGNPEALAEIVRAADKLTNGKFGRHFFAGQQPVAKTEMIFSEVNNTVHNGYFLKSQGDATVKRDIREVDYLYVLNRFGTMDKTALDWAMTFLVNHMNPYQRMARRKEIIEACVGGRVHITGYSERHTFSDHFVKSLFASCLESGLKPNFQYNNPLAGANTGVVAPSFTSSGLITGSLLQAGFNTGGNNASAGGAFFNPTQGRY